MEINAIRIHQSDNVAVAVEKIPGGAEIVSAAGSLGAAAEDIPRGHKVALSGIPKGAAVAKYGETIGVASKEIGAGRHVNENNMKAEDA